MGRARYPAAGEARGESNADPLTSNEAWRDPGGCGGAGPSPLRCASSEMEGIAFVGTPHIWARGAQRRDHADFRLGLLHPLTLCPVICVPAMREMLAFCIFAYLTSHGAMRLTGCVCETRD